MSLAADPLRWLLPDDPERCARAAPLVTGLRLLRASGRNLTSPSTGVSGERARRELDRRTEDRRTRAIEDLLRHHLAAAQPADAWLWFGWCQATAHDAWRVLVGEPRGRASATPAPGEAPLEVARRLVEDADWGPARAALWRARLAWISGEHETAREAWVSLAEDPAWCAEVAVDRAAAALERGRVRRALEHLGLAAAAQHPRGQRLRRWCRLLTGEDPGPVDGLLEPASGGPVPAGLLAWRERRPHWLPYLAGPAQETGVAVAPEPAPQDRGAIGAVVLAVIAQDEGLAWRTLRLDLAPALEERRATWIRGRAGAWAVTGEPEQELVAGAAPVVRWADGEEPPRGALGETTRALALVPFHEQGEVVGWLHLEWEHLGVPSEARLRAWADAWRSRWCEARRPQRPEARLCPPPAECALDELPSALEGLGLGLARRRWSVLAIGPEGPELWAHGGGGLPVTAHDLGPARAVLRALRIEGPVSWEEPLPGLAIHADAASGHVEPLRVGGRLVGALALESSRRRDLGEHERTRLRAVAPRVALALSLARHRRRALAAGDRDPFLPLAEPAFARFAAQLVARDAPRTPLTLVGPVGSGRRALALWIASTLTPGRAWRILDPTALAPRAQERLSQRLAVASGVERHAFLLTAPPDSSSLEPALARRLLRRVVHLPPLADRRAELFSWIDGLLARLAREEGLTPPRLDRELRAMLWRQPWPGGLHDLDAALHRLTRLAPGGILDVSTAAPHLASLGIERGQRPDPRAPRRDDLLAAIAVTRTARGRVNKTAAAALLHMDPDTLVARLAEQALEADAVPAPDPFAAHAGR